MEWSQVVLMTALVVAVCAIKYGCIDNQGSYKTGASEGREELIKNQNIEKECASMNGTKTMTVYVDDYKQAKRDQQELAVLKKWLADHDEPTEPYQEWRTCGYPTPAEEFEHKEYW